MDNFRSLYGVKVTKRPEESYKFVFKHVFKHLKERFRKNVSETSRVDNTDFNLMFYEYYFGEASKKLEIGINHFFLPLTPDSNCNENKNVIAQTINIDYITLICQSKHFIEDFMEFVNNCFFKEYSTLIDLKVYNLCEKWEHIFICADGDQKVIGYICDYITSNKKCKLPWTLKEVEYAIDIVNKFIQKCSIKALILPKILDRFIV